MKRSAISPNGLAPKLTSLLAGVLAFATGAGAQTFNVTGGDGINYTINGQSDPTLTLQRGTTYMFVVNTPGHPFYIKTARVTGTGSAYTNGVTGNGVQSGTLTFAVPITAPNQLFYQCSPHISMGGTINISNAPNALPSVTITNPPNGAKFIAPATVALGADASDSDGSVTNVQFVSGNTALGEDTTAPFALGVNNLSPGNYAFIAIASDNRGARTTSSVVNVFVLTNALLALPQWVNGQFRFTVSGIAGQTYISESSSGLSNWGAFSTNVAPANSFEVVDPNASISTSRSYRVRQAL